ncbi:MAG TPA: lysophospholipid acyltransferase family protein [Polyangiales bacterium]|nr:lysophospholipid acyltransferase family protein [Polyangiales bacterium]
MTTRQRHIRAIERFIRCALKRDDPNLLQHRDADFMRQVTALFQRTVYPYHRAEVRGLQRIPRDASLIYIGNHNGFPYMSEAFVFTSALFEHLGMRDYPYLLMHDFAFRFPLANQFFTRYGGLRASRENAERVLQRDASLLIYPGGDAELMRPYRERTRLKFQGRTGHVRLAIEYDRPIVPFVSVGGHSISIIVHDLPWLAQILGAKRWLRVSAWPLVLSFPWGLTLGPIIPPYLPWPSRIIIEALEPMRFTAPAGTDPNDPGWVAQCAKRLEDTMEAALRRLEAERVGKPARNEPSRHEAAHAGADDMGGRQRARNPRLVALEA